MLNVEEMDRKLKLFFYAELVALAMIICMAAFENAQLYYFPLLETWQSQVLTIIFSSFIVSVAGYFVMHRLQSLHRNIVKQKSEGTRSIFDIFQRMHDPLTSIKGFANVLRTDENIVPQDRMEYLRIVEEEADRLARLVEQLMEITSIDAGHLKMNPKTIRLKEIIEGNIEDLKGQAEKMSVTVEKNITPELTVYADNDKTREIVMNLLSNAIKYNKEGGKVTVEAKENDGKVKVEIRDTGFGISEKDKAHLFEKFHKFDKASKQSAGLGLVLTKSLVEVQGGTMSVESVENEGSKFAFTLPKGANN